MFSRLPAQFGDTPVKVIFEGVEPGSAQAQLLYRENQAEITHFHTKARQSLIQSEQPGAHMQQAMADGGRMRYSFNNGQEILTVKLEPPPQIVPVDRPVREPIPTAPHLAIDVLLNNVLHLVADVYSKVETTPAQDEYVDVSTQFIGLPETWAAAQSAALGTISCTYLYDGYTDGYMPYLYELEPPPMWPYAQTAADSSIPTYPPATGSAEFETHYGIFEVVVSGSEGPETGYQTVVLDRITRTLVPAQPARYTHYRKQYYYFDTLVAVGLRAPPEGGADTYTAISVPTSEEPDARLYPVTSGPNSAARELLVDEALPLHATGQGFVALPRVPLPLSIPGALPPTVIEVYIGSDNTTKANEYPGPVGATLEDDDPSFVYDYLAEVGWVVRVREFPGTPSAVGVTTTTERRMVPWEPPLGPPPELGEAVPLEDTPPTVELPEEVEPSARTARWGFAADKTWQELSEAAEPADPGADGMGTLLAELSGTTAVAGVDPLARVIDDTVDWPGAVTDMTRIAVITWQPPRVLGRIGSATIEPA